MRRQQQIDRWHFTSAGWSTESRGSPKSDNIFQTSGTTPKTSSSFQKEHIRQAGWRFQRTLVTQKSLALFFSHCMEVNAKLFLLALLPTGTVLHPSFLSPSLCLSLSKHLLCSLLSYGSVCYTISPLG